MDLRDFPSGQRGGTFVGMLIGIVIGLAAAVVTALFVTKANVPFIGAAPKSALPQSGPASDAAPARASADVPDPNRTLVRPRESAAAHAEATRVAPVVAPQVATTQTTPTAPTAPPYAPARGDAPVIVATPSGGARTPAVPQSRTQVATASSTTSRSEQATTYLLQAGAFRSGDDAEGMKAKLALMGFEASVVPGEVNGNTLYRVRVGPYAGLDVMNRARARLAENGIEASVLRQR